MSEIVTPLQPLSVQSLSAGYEVIVVHPRSLRDMPDVVQALRSQKAVILNLESLDTRLAQRVSDFAAGSAYAIAGHQQQLGKGVFLYTPDSIKIGNRPQPLASQQTREDSMPEISEAS